MEEYCRPGGPELTEELLDLFRKYRPGADREPLAVLDVGCGTGAAALHLSAQHPGWKICGIDPSPAGSGERKPAAGDAGPVLLRGEAEHLPFADGSFDLLLMECVYSRLEDPEAALGEALRVLRPGGKLLMSDLFLRERTPGSGAGEEDAVRFLRSAENRGSSCRVGRLESAEEILERLRQAGYGILEFQDVSRRLGSWVADRILNGDGGSLEEELGMAPEELRRRRCGYFLGVFEPSPLWETLRYAAGRSPFYRRKWAGELLAAAAAAGPGDWELFRSLPFTTAGEISAAPEDFLCVPPKEIARIITLKSSGSTGAPKRIFFTEEDLERTADFFTYGMKPLVEPGWRTAVFMEGRGHFTVGGLLKEALSRIGVETKVCGFITDLPRAAADAEGMDTLVGVPWQMLRLAEEAPGLRPKTVLLSADYVPETGIALLEKIWHCRVFTHWGMSETGYGGAVQCAARKAYHVRDEDLLIEILHPETGAEMPGREYGEIVLTTLRRRGMPLIRLRTGDLGRMSTEPCPCGCRKPRLDKVMGRIGEGARLPGGGFLTIQMLDEELLQIPEIRNFSACWKSSGSVLVLTVETALDASQEVPEVLREEIPARLRPLLGEEVRVEILPGMVTLSDGVHKRRLSVI